MPKIIIQLLMAGGVIMIALVVLVRYLERAGVFFPSRIVQAHPGQMRLPWEDIYFTTSDGVKINGWFISHSRATATVLFAHGNAGNVGDRLLKIKYFYDLGFNVFIFDYRGYGRSEGKPTELGIYLDAQAAFDYVASRPGVDIKRLIVYGASLGGTVAIDLSKYRAVPYLIVDSSITSAKEVAKIFYPYVPTFFMCLKLDSLSKVKTLTMPKLFMHSINDQVVPFAMGQRLYAAAGEPKEFIELHGGHNDAPLASDPVAAAQFIKYLRSQGLL